MTATDRRRRVFPSFLAAALLLPALSGAAAAQAVHPPASTEGLRPPAASPDVPAPPAAAAPPAAHAPAAPDPMTPQHSDFRGPASVADLAEGLLDAVVNVSTSQDVKVDQAVPKLEAPEGSPLQDFFDNLLKDGDEPSSRRLQSLGSGFVVDPSGIIVTNNHVIADADEISVNFPNGTKLDATVVGKDLKTDIAVLKVKPTKPLKAVKFGNSEKLRIGDWVMAIGNPFGLGGSVTVGIVSARGRNINAGPYDNFIQTDAAINRGNSGGPLFDMHGDVVGINTAIISPTGGSIGIGFSIPSRLAENVVNQLRQYGETRRGWLGVRLQAVTDDIADGLQLPEAKGAIVMGIVKGGPSDNGLLKVGDVIVGFDGQAVDASRDLPRIVAETPVGKDVPVDILRKETRDTPAHKLTVSVKLGRLEDGEKQASAEPETPKNAGATKPQDQPFETLGMKLGEIDDQARSQFDLKKDLTGVLITAVNPASAAAEKGIESGSVIKEVAQESVATAKDVQKKIGDLKAEGRKNALLLVASNSGELRLVVVPID